jgi:hypothetical protein
MRSGTHKLFSRRKGRTDRQDENNTRVRLPENKIKNKKFSVQEYTDIIGVVMDIIVLVSSVEESGFKFNIR